MSRRGRLPAISLDDLDTWLASQPDIALRNWTVTSIDGFCAAPLAGPERIETNAWLRVIFGPSLPATPMGLGAVQAVLERHEAVRRMLALDGGRRWHPLYLRTDDGTFIAQPWAAGCMFAVKRWPAAWRPMFERGDHVALMLPIIASDATEEGEQHLKGKPDALAHVAQAYHHIREAVRAIRTHWRLHTP
jgi:yecA family protein